VAIAIGNLTASILVVPIYFYLFKNYKIGKFDSVLLKKYFKISIPVIFIGFSTNLISQLDKVLLQFFTSSAHVGYYTAGFRFAGFIQLLGVVVGSLLMPDFSRLFKENNHQEIAKKIYKFERFNFIFLLPLVLLVAIQSDIIVTFLLGNEFLESIDIMSITTIALFILIMNTPYGSVITGYGNFKLAAILSFLSLLIFLFFASILANPSVFGLAGKGMAIALLPSHLFLGIMFRIKSLKYLDQINVYFSLKYISAGIVLFLFGKYFYINFFITNTLKIIFPLAFLSISILFYYIFKLCNKNDFTDLINIFNIRSMYNYITSEIKS